MINLTVKETVSRYHADLISRTEAITILASIQTRAAHDRDYSDTLESFKRFDNIYHAARVARYSI